VAALAPPGALGAKPAPEYVFQNVQLAPFDRSHTFVLKGKATSEGCVYSYPDVTLPADAPAWQVRDLGVDMKTCTKLVEEGIPTKPSVDDADTTVTAAIGGSDSAGSVVAAVVTHSGYTSARFENVFGQTLTKDTTHVTWGISGGCVTAGSVYGEWTWNHVYYSMESNGGTENRTCSRQFGQTWSTFRNNISGCRIWLTWVNALGNSNGIVTGSRSDSAQCSPVWEHFDIVTTT
jgi:hypothetical protein